MPEYLKKYPTAVFPDTQVLSSAPISLPLIDIPATAVIQTFDSTAVMIRSYKNLKGFYAWLLIVFSLCPDAFSHIIAPSRNIIYPHAHPSVL